MSGLKIWAWIMSVLATIALISWGVYGITAWMSDTGTGFHLVDWLFTFGGLIETKIIAYIVYIIVGIIGLTLIPTVIAMGNRRR